MSDDREKIDLDVLKSHTAQLGEHFDTVQIFVTRNNSDEDGTVSVQWGEGNWFARYGQVKSWIIREEESTRVDTRKGREE